MSTWNGIVAAAYLDALKAEAATLRDDPERSAAIKAEIAAVRAAVTKRDGDETVSL